MVRHYGFTLDICMSVYLSVFWSVVHLLVSLFSDNNLGKFQWLITKLGFSINIMDIWFRVANGQILIIFGGIIVSCFYKTIFS